MMQGEWMGSWGTGFMGGGGLWMVLVAVLLVVAIIAVSRKK